MKGVNLSSWALGHRSLIVYCMLAITLGGIYSFFGLGRSEDPNFTIKTMVVHARWPGATLDETLQQVTDRLERKLQETPHLDFLRSYTSPGETTIFVNLLGATSASEVPDIWYQVRKNIGDIRSTLPAEVVGPAFNDDFGATYGIIYGFLADGYTQRELRDRVEAIRSELLNVQDVEKIDIVGAQDEQIVVEFSIRRLAGLGLDPAALVAALRAQNIIAPAGTIESGKEKLFLRVTGAFASEQDILNINLSIGGRLVRLRDIADVRRMYADPPQPFFRVNGQQAIGLAIAMREGGDVLAMGRNVAEAMHKIEADLPWGIEPVLVANQPQIVQTAIGEFTTSLWQAIAIIIGVSLLSLGLRAGAVIAVSIPLTLAIVFAIMYLWHIDLHRISLGALIIALALLVDDAMTMVDVTSTRLALGEAVEEASAYAYRDLAFPMLTGTFVTAAGFIPIGFARSSAGEYTFSIFSVVGIALVVSWFVAVLFVPLLSKALLRAPKAGAGMQAGLFMRAFRRCLTVALRWRWVTVGATLVCFALALFLLGKVQQQFFPHSDRLELVVELREAQNASIFKTAEMAERFDRWVAEQPEVDHWSTYVGRGAVRFFLPLNVQLQHDFLAQAIIVTRDLAARDRLQDKLETKLAEDFPELVTRVTPLDLGPGAGWPIQYRVSGPDVERVRQLASELAQVVSADASIRHINFDWMEPARVLRIHVDQDKARLLGLSSQSISALLDSVVSGAPITQVRDGIYLINVIARAAEDERLSLATLRSLQVPLANGQSVPLNAFANVQFDQEYPLVWRRDRVPTLTLQADIAPDMLPQTVVARLAPAIAKFEAGLPSGYRIALGGVAEESAKSQASVFAVVPVMLLVMVTLLMVQLHSFRRILLVMGVVPMGLIGIVAALLLFDRPLGFVAILGIIALMGMIARNAVILLEQIETERAAGKDNWNAVLDASMSRFRPIMLTAISTVLGMIPIAYTIFWGPMAFAIMGGLLVATILTLIFLPALYLICFRVRAST